MLEILYRATGEIGYFIPKLDFWVFMTLALLLGWAIAYLCFKIFTEDKEVVQK